MTVKLSIVRQVFIQVVLIFITITENQILMVIMNLSTMPFGSSGSCSCLVNAQKSGSLFLKFFGFKRTWVVKQHFWHKNLAGK